MRNKGNKISKKVILGIIVAIIVIAIVIAEIIILINKEDTTLSTGLNTEVWLGPNETVGVDNGADNIVLKVESDLNYEEGVEFEVPYILTVNDIEY